VFFFAIIEKGSHGYSDPMHPQSISVRKEQTQQLASASTKTSR
jgi:hypothetical protein